MCPNTMKSHWEDKKREWCSMVQFEGVSAQITQFFRSAPELLAPNPNLDEVQHRITSSYRAAALAAEFIVARQGWQDAHLDNLRKDFFAAYRRDPDHHQGQWHSKLTKLLETLVTASMTNREDAWQAQINDLYWTEPCAGYRESWEEMHNHHDVFIQAIWIHWMLWLRLDAKVKPYFDNHQRMRLLSLEGLQKCLPVVADPTVFDPQGGDCIIVMRQEAKKTKGQDKAVTGNTSPHGIKRRGRK